MEKIVGNAILTMIRSRREPPASPTSDSGGSSTAMPARVREAQFSDYEAATNLKRRWGLIPDSLENWERLWLHNPALKQLQTGRAIGWVLEAEGRVVGYLGNISSLYRFGDKTLTAVTGSGLVVEPAYRAVGFSLNAAFFRQKSVDLFLTTTAIDAVGKIALIFKSDPLPQEDYETVLLWVLRSYPFAQAVMNKLQLRPALSQVVGRLASLAVGIDKLIRRRWPRASAAGFTLSEININEVGKDFEDLWNEKLGEGKRLLADRSPESLRWHFAIPGDRAQTRVLCCHKNGQLAGYLVIRDEASEANGLQRSRVADMLIRQDNPKVLGALMVSAYEHAMQAGSHIFELQGFPASVRRQCTRWKPYMRKYPACPFFYKGATPTLHAMLRESVAWYATPFDGDATLMPQI
jgi:hypothetical protein